MSRQIIGGCLCGAVRYESDAEPEMTLFCHCIQCQKESGGPFSTEVIVPGNSISISGVLSEYDSVSDSGSKVIRKFCGVCGSPILIEFEREDYRDSVCIKAGSLDDASWLQPEFHCFTSTKQPWVHICDDLPQFTGDTQAS